MVKQQEALLLLLDVGPSMHPALSEIEKVCSMLVQKKLIYSKYDEVGIVLFGTEEFDEGTKEEQVTTIAKQMTAHGIKMESIIMRGKLSQDANKGIMDENDRLLNIFSKETSTRLLYVENPISLFGALRTRNGAPVTVLGGHLEINPTLSIKAEALFLFPTICKDRGTNDNNIANVMIMGNKNKASACVANRRDTNKIKETIMSIQSLNVVRQQIMTKKEMTKFGYAKKTNLYSGLVVTSFTFEALHSVFFLLQRKGTCTQGWW
ncbi:hypothetical protein JHK85_016762 [Glycine max]|nr:hypothetical protein JHK85_016762 [Glycine max]